MLDKQDIALLEGMFSRQGAQFDDKMSHEIGDLHYEIDDLRHEIGDLRHESGDLRGELKRMFQENNAELRKEFRADLKNQLEQFRSDFRRDLIDQANSLISASEHRVIAIMTAKMDKMKTEIISEVTDFIGESLLPQIEELQVDMIVVNRQLKLA